MSNAWECCVHCGREVKLNGVGSDANFWQKMLKSTLGAINPVTTNLFRPCADVHDMLYHQGDVYGLGLYEAQKDADDTFLELCLYYIDNPKEAGLGLFNSSLVLSNKWYFRYKAHQYYWALRKGGSSVYPKLPCTHKDRIFIQGDVKDVEVTA